MKRKVAKYEKYANSIDLKNEYNHNPNSFYKHLRVEKTINIGGRIIVIIFAVLCLLLLFRQFNGRTEPVSFTGLLEFISNCPVTNIDWSIGNVSLELGFPFEWLNPVLNVLINLLNLITFLITGIITAVEYLFYFLKYLFL